MKAITNLIATIEKYGTLTTGYECTNKSGIRYRYDHCEINMENAPYWMQKMFEESKKEVYGTNDVAKLTRMNKNYRIIEFDNYSISCNYASYKGQPCGKISYHKLIKL